MNQTAGSPLEKVRLIEKKRMADVPKDSRPAFHLSSPVGWMNDPNGFSFYKGEYHLFFQYHPFTNAWGPMHWGHCKSRDLLHWEYLPAAMAPDTDYDAGGCYSGSALEAEGKHILVYTGIIDRYLEDGTHDYRQVQCLAAGDGLDYEKYDKNPVLSGDDLPAGGNPADFRDPKIWKEEDGYYLVAGNRAKDGCGQILLYRSDDLKVWEYLTVLDQSRGTYGRMWECPDFFPLGEKHILMVSPQDMRAKGYEFHNGNNSIFIYGQYEKKSHRFQREKVTSADYGLDFYAPQTLLAPDGRRILIGWMQSWDVQLMKDDFPWTGMMTVPRELSMKNGRICQKPVRELENYRKNKVEYNTVISETTFLKGVCGRILDLEVEIKSFDFRHFMICFAQNEDYEMVLQYNQERKLMTIDRTHSGLVRDVVCRRKMEAAPMKESSGEQVLRLRLLLDRYSAEIFVNQGERVMTAVFRTPMEADGITFDCDGSACIHVTKYDICM